MSGIIGYYTLNNHGEPLDVTVVVSNRAKRVIIKIKDKVILTVPENFNINLAYDFLNSKEKLIRKKYFTGAEQKHFSKSGSLEFIEILGRKLKIELEYSQQQDIRIDADRIIIESSKSYKKLFKDFLKQMLHEEISFIVNEIALREGFLYSKITVKELNSIWGSCSVRGNLSFNWRLIFAPIEVLNYVIIHELCHLKEMNHSRRFWIMVSGLCPDYKEHVKWLKLNGKMLGYHKIFQ